MKKFISIFLVIIILGELAAIGFLLYTKFLIEKETAPTKEEIPSSSQFQSPSIVPTNRPENLLLGEPFKRFIDPTLKFYGQNYPAEITNTNEADLIGLQCGEISYLTADSLQITQINKPTYKEGPIVPIETEKTKAKSEKISDPRTLKFIEEINKKEERAPLQYIFCKGENNFQFFVLSNSIYNETLKEAFPVGVFIETDENNLKDFIYTEPANDPTGFWRCAIPIQLTKNNLLYWGCRGGEFSPLENLYKVDFSLKKATKLISCVYDSEKKTSKCN